MCFLGFEQVAKNNGNYKWEALTCAKLNVPFTRCFEGQTHLVLNLCMGEKEREQFSWYRTGFFKILELEPYMLEAYLRKSGSLGIPVKNKTNQGVSSRWKYPPMIQHLIKPTWNNAAVMREKTLTINVRGIKIHNGQKALMRGQYKMPNNDQRESDNRPTARWTMHN